jgi:putative membrane protein
VLAAALALVPEFVNAQVTTTSGGEVALKITQKNVVDQLIVRDSLEIALAELAASRSQNAAVKDLASALATDAKAHLENLQKLAGNADVGREAGADRSAAAIADALAKLQAIPADKTAEFDKAFVDTQIALHEAAVAAYATYAPAAAHAELKSDLDAAVPQAQKHLEAAKALSAQLAKPDAAKPDAKKPDSTAKAIKPPVR